MISSGSDIVDRQMPLLSLRLASLSNCDSGRSQVLRNCCSPWSRRARLGARCRTNPPHGAKPVGAGEPRSFRDPPRHAGRSRRPATQTSNGGRVASMNSKTSARVRVRRQSGSAHATEHWTRRSAMSRSCRVHSKCTTAPTRPGTSAAGSSPSMRRVEERQALPRASRRPVSSQKRRTAPLASGRKRALAGQALAGQVEGRSAAAS
jgi:hypothetical protein